MKIIRPTLESLLEEVEVVFISIGHNDGIISLIAGGVDKKGKWNEFSSAIGDVDSIHMFEKMLKLMIFFIAQENKKWALEQDHHRLIRDRYESLN